jgi:MoaA/NifB/PqqE/SkfB family radical SAM enzyme
MMTGPVKDPQPGDRLDCFPMKLWIYTNYHCNLRCTYCVAESSPKAPRRIFDLDAVQRIIDDAAALAFQHVYFTGGEPFLLDDIYEMLSYASERLPTTILTNAMLFHGGRLERLVSIRDDNLVLQISLDGSRPEHHDPYRGPGTWQKTVDGIRTALQHGFKVRISTTETPANTHYLEEICDFRRSLGIADQDHIIRPLAKRGFSKEGVEVSKETLIPELTLNVDGIFWHPLSTDPDLLVSTEIFPLADGLSRAKAEYQELRAVSTADMHEFQ